MRMRVPEKPVVPFPQGDSVTRRARKIRRPWLPLLAAMLFVQGCGLGWLYMKIGDSKRIAGLKMLSYDTQATRFKTAQKTFNTAIGYYKDSILYDEISNPEVYHRMGFTYLLLIPETTRDGKSYRSSARSYFIKGLKMLRRGYDQSGSARTAEMIQLENEVRQELQITDDIDGTTPVPDSEDSGELGHDDFFQFTDDNYARNHAGLGELAFLEAITNRAETSYKTALFHFKLAERASSRKGRKAGSRNLTAKILNFFNLEEITQDVPYIVEVAKVHNFMALSYRRQGNSKLEQDHFKMAKDALDQAKNDFPNDPRVYAEDARLSFYQRDYNKALSAIKKVLSETNFYADKREFIILQGQIYNEMREADEAQKAFQWVLDREPLAIEAILGRAMAAAIRKDRTSAMADVQTVRDEGGDEDPYLMRRIANVYLTLGDRLPASTILLKAYYIDKEDIELVFSLASLKYEMNESQEACDLFKKVLTINLTSDYARKAEEKLAELGCRR